MEPRREAVLASGTRPQEKPKRFRIVKLEERIAPSGGNGTNNCPAPSPTVSCLGGCTMCCDLKHNQGCG